MTKWLPVLLIALPLVSGACRKETAPPTGTSSAPRRTAQPASETYEAQLTAWQKGRQERLRKDDSWFTVVGLWWLEEGDNAFGSDASAPVRLPAGKSAPIGGAFRLVGGKVSITAKPGSGVMSAGKPVTSMELKSDADGEPTMLNIARVQFYVIKRADRFAVRVKDPDSEARRSFKGLDYYPVRPEMRFEARFIPYDPPKKIAIPNITGQVTEESSPGAILFEHEGTAYRLDPISEQGSDELFVIFADATNGEETYGAGRFLYTELPKEGKVTLDFNRAYNPPCAFTAFATCPLPPRQNKLPIRIEAGEKAYHLPAHP
jgi:hypothetical protein